MSTSATLGALCAEAGLRCPEGAAETLIQGVTCDSRRVRPGWLFIAVPGMHCDARKFIPDVERAGAAAVVTADGPVPAAGIPVIETNDVRRAAAYLFDAWYGHPGRRLRLAGITGTNGKTSTACMLTHILRAAGEQAGMIGTLGYTLPRGVSDGPDGPILPADKRAAMTTPDPEELYAILDRMASGEGKTPIVVMEVSSHALALGKVAPLRFDVGVFTNLSPEHLDFHGTMENYCAAKEQLFRQADVGVINGDDACVSRLPADVRGPARWLICRSGVTARRADTPCPDCCCNRYDAGQIRSLGLAGVEYRLVSPAARLRIRCPVPGDFTVSNSLEAAAAALALGVSPVTVKEALACFPGVPGRMERIPVRADFSVFIDYAHTPDALEKLLLTFHRAMEAEQSRERGRIILLFGCGGDRDREKRKVMARIASAMADVTVITSDNSRSEDPDAIIAEILKGIDKESEYTVIPDRAEAIRWALRHARSGDVVLLCGKGHETYEIDRTGRHPFDERRIVREVVESRTD